MAPGALARAEDDICVAQPTAASLLAPIISHYGFLRGISHQDSEIERHGRWKRMIEWRGRWKRMIERLCQ